MFLGKKCNAFFYAKKDIPTGRVRIKKGDETLVLDRAEAFRLAKLIIANEIQVSKKASYFFEGIISPKELYDIIVTKMWN